MNGIRKDEYKVLNKIASAKLTGIPMYVKPSPCADIVLMTPDGFAAFGFCSIRL